ncbi:MAG: hypothetical protein H6711_32975 [Myxococcales bacterium]|nr:hypothetical protein [Myxococcales bacterium]
MSLNPYIAGPTVGQTPAFVGREGIIERVLQSVYRRDVTLIHGQRRVGKTSILIEVEARLPPPYLGVYFDANLAPSTGRDDLVAALVRRLSRKFGAPGPRLGEGAAEIFRQQWLPDFLKAHPDAVLVLLIDEFDVAVDADEFMRYLETFQSGRRGRLTTVFAIGRSIRDLPEQATRFFKSATTIPVSLMERHEHDAIVRLCEREDPPALTWTDAAIEAIWGLTHGHAYLTQQICLTMWERSWRAGPKTIDAAEVLAARAEVLDRSSATLQWLWDGLTPECKVATAALAEEDRGHLSRDGLMRRLEAIGIEINAEVEAIPNHLKDWDILEALDDSARVFAFRVELFRRWVREQRPLDMVWYDLDRTHRGADRAYQDARKSDKPNAERLCQEALRLNKNHSGARELLAEILAERRRFKESIDVIDVPVDFRPESRVQRQRQAILLRWLRDADANPDEQERERIYAQVGGLDLDEATRSELLGRYRALGDEAFARSDFARARGLYELAGDGLRASRATAEWRVRRVTRVLFWFVSISGVLGIIAVASIFYLVRATGAAEAERDIAEKEKEALTKETEALTREKERAQGSEAQQREELARIRATTVSPEELAGKLLDVIAPALGIRGSEDGTQRMILEELVAAMARPPTSVPAAMLAGLRVDQYLVLGKATSDELPWGAIKINVFSRAHADENPPVAFDSSLGEPDGANGPISACVATAGDRAWPLACEKTPGEDVAGLRHELTRCAPESWIDPDVPGSADAIVCLAAYRPSRERPLVEWGLIAGDWCLDGERRVHVGVSGADPAVAEPVLIPSYASRRTPNRLRRFFLLDEPLRHLRRDESAQTSFESYLGLFATNDDPAFRGALVDARRSIAAGGGDIAFFSSGDQGSDERPCPGRSLPGVEYHVLTYSPPDAPPISESPWTNPEWSEAIDPP